MSIHALLTDIVSHTQSLGFMSEVDVIGTDEETVVVAVADDRTVAMEGKLKVPVSEFIGTFSMSKMDKLNHHLKNPEYKEEAIITIIRETRKGAETPTGISFVNKSGDFQNSFRFSVKTSSETKRIRSLIKDWDVTITPDQRSIQRFKLQATANSEYKTCQICTDSGNIVLYFGSEATHAGNFVFQSNVSGSLIHRRTYPVDQLLSIMNLQGEKKMDFSDFGAIRISVSSDLIDYQYTVRALS